MTVSRSRARLALTTQDEEDMDFIPWLALSTLVSLQTP